MPQNLGFNTPVLHVSFLYYVDSIYFLMILQLKKFIGKVLFWWENHFTKVCCDVFSTHFLEYSWGGRILTIGINVIFSNKQHGWPILEVFFWNINTIFDTFILGFICKWNQNPCITVLGTQKYEKIYMHWNFIMIILI